MIDQRRLLSKTCASADPSNKRHAKPTADEVRQFHVQTHAGLAINGSPICLRWAAKLRLTSCLARASRGRHFPVALTYLLPLLSCCNCAPTICSQRSQSSWLRLAELHCQTIVALVYSLRTVDSVHHRWRLWSLRQRVWTLSLGPNPGLLIACLYLTSPNTNTRVALQKIFSSLGQRGRHAG